MPTIARSQVLGERLAALAALAAVLPLAACDNKAISPLDRIPPQVEIVSPLEGDDVSGVGFFVQVTATDDNGVDRVLLRVNDVVTASDSAPPYELFVPSIAETESAPLAIEVEARDDNGNFAIDAVTVSPNARTATQITFDTNADKNPSWSPDGSRLAFQSNRFGQWDLFSIDDDGANELRLTSNLNDDENPAWSPDGVVIAFDSERAGAGVEADLWQIVFISGEASATALTFGNNDDREPAWSRTGSTLAFASDRGVGNQTDLWSLTLAGGAATQLTALAEPDASPAYAPFDDRIAFVSTLNFGTPHVYVRQTDATVAPVSGDVTFTESDPAWSPDGNSVLYARRTGAHSNVWIMVLDRPAPVQVTFATGIVGDAGPQWSPDGSAIALHSDRNGNLDLYVVR